MIYSKYLQRRHEKLVKFYRVTNLDFTVTHHQSFFVFLFGKQCAD